MSYKQNMIPEEHWGSTAGQWGIISAKSFPVKASVEKYILVRKCSSEYSAKTRFGIFQKKNNQKFFLRAVLLRDFLDGDAHLIAQVPPCVHHAVRPFTQNHLVAVLVGLVYVLQKENKHGTGNWARGEKYDIISIYT